uniref:Uncharacterized protein n=1 Tax=Anguilla anguilla TaxID=7936 RepID=A0A0E9S7Z3_ANGAN
MVLEIKTSNSCPLDRGTKMNFLVLGGYYSLIAGF